VEPSRPATSPARAADWRPPDFAAVQEFLQLLARAVRQFRTYPHTSPLCVDAAVACHTAFGALTVRERLTCRVTPTELIVDEIGVGAGSIVEHELVRRLHRAQVASLDIDRGASLRDLSRFIADLITVSDAGKSHTTLGDMLAEHGVASVVPRQQYCPEIFSIGAPPAPMCELVRHERTRRQQASPPGAPAQYLYPPDKGWIRLDPAAHLDQVSLVDLTVLVDDPAEIAQLLLRLTDDAPGDATREAALERKFSDLTTLFSAVDPRLARLLFAKLARAVLNLDTERRNELLKRTILPGLLDGRADGSVLTDFPDLDLAEALCLLLELETASPEVLTAALDRLNLSPERRKAVVPLLDAKVRGNQDPMASQPALDRYARGLIRVESRDEKSFAEFAAFDLSVTDQTRSALATLRQAIEATEPFDVQLACLHRLTALEPSPAIVEGYVQRALEYFAALEAQGRWRDLADWAGRYRGVADAGRETRADVATSITTVLATFCTVPRAVKIGELYAGGDQRRETAARFVHAFGDALALASVAALDDQQFQADSRPLVGLLCEHARVLAPALADRLGHIGIAPRRAVVKALGYAGAGYEGAIAAQLDGADELTTREAFRALARIGTVPAAAAAAAKIGVGPAWLRGAAEEALWHFPQPIVATELRRLLARREFVLRCPEAVVRLLDRAAQTHTPGLGEVLAPLTSLRYRFWNRSLVAVAIRARAMLRS
jgi:hypothetical protein